MLLPTLWNSMFATILLASLACVSVPAVAAEAQINSKVAAGKWKAVRLKNLPEGASLGVKVIATGSLVAPSYTRPNSSATPHRLVRYFRTRWIRH